MNTSRQISTVFGLITAAVILSITIPASAHYLWLNVHDYTPRVDQSAKFTVGWGHSFYNPVGDILYGREILDGIYMIDPRGKKIGINALNEFQYESAEKLSQGTYLAMVQRKEGFSTKTTEGYKRQPKKGLSGIIHSHYLGMYGKAIINAGNPSKGETVMKPLGYPLEIVPLVNPSDLKAGDYFRFQLLYQGQPVAEYINATYAGFSYVNAWAYSTRTDAQGVGEIKILNSGIWIVHANHKVPYPDPDEADEYSYTTTLTFEVR